MTWQYNVIVKGEWEKVWVTHVTTDIYSKLPRYNLHGESCSVSSPSMYESAIYFADISYICLYEGNAKKRQIFRVEWHRFLPWKFAFFRHFFHKNRYMRYLQNKWHNRNMPFIIRIGPDRAYPLHFTQYRIAAAGAAVDKNDLRMGCYLFLFVFFLALSFDIIKFQPLI